MRFLRHTNTKNDREKDGWSCIDEEIEKTHSRFLQGRQDQGSFF
jgi:hypothetical protein